VPGRYATVRGRSGSGFGCAGVTVRGAGDLGPVGDWLSGPRDRPLVIDAKVASASGSWWLEEAFPGIDRARPGSGPVGRGTGEGPGRLGEPARGLARPRGRH
jgi:hypothetical protein